jgi:spore coat polysaccharide biosynthesis protein SpsF (cytidylyltransferase family)
MHNLPMVIVQARMSSSRLPGKMLKQVKGKPILTYVIERLRCCKNTGDLIIATSDNESDDGIKKLCDNLGVKCFRGDLDNVATRFLSIVKKEKLHSFVRINGDSPMIDSEIIDYAVSLFDKSKCDIVTNVFPRTYPKGQSVEVLNTKNFNTAVLDVMSDEDKEHVTTFFYRNSDQFDIVNFQMQPESNHVQLSIDTKKDFMDFEAIVSRMDKTHTLYHLNEILSLREKVKKQIA